MTPSLVWPVNLRLRHLRACTHRVSSIKEYSFSWEKQRDTKGVFGVLFYLLYEKNREILKECLDIVVGGLYVEIHQCAGKNYTRPNSRARATASVRRWTPSLPKIVRLSPFTV